MSAEDCIGCAGLTAERDALKAAVAACAEANRSQYEKLEAAEQSLRALREAVQDCVDNHCDPGSVSVEFLKRALAAAPKGTE